MIFEIFLQEYDLSVKQIGFRSVLLGLIWFQYFCKCFEKTTVVSNEISIPAPGPKVIKLLNVCLCV